MIDELQKYLYQILARVDGLFCIIISDREGVPILKVSSDQAPEIAARPNFISTYTSASDQATKLGLGQNRCIISMYQKFQLIQMNKAPLIISFIADAESNTGLILTLEDYIDPILKDITPAVLVEA